MVNYKNKYLQMKLKYIYAKQKQKQKAGVIEVQNLLEKGKKLVAEGVAEGKIEAEKLKNYTENAAKQLGDKVKKTVQDVGDTLEQNANKKIPTMDSLNNQKKIIDELESERKKYYHNLASYIDNLNNNINDKKKIIDSVKGKEVLENIRKQLMDDHEKTIEMIDNAIKDIQKPTTT